MSLTDRREVEKFKTEHFDKLKKQINDVAGSNIDIDVNWSELAEQGAGDSYAEAFPVIFFEPVIKALKEIAIDQMGKDAINNGLKKIEMKNTSKKYGAMAFTFDNGVLTIDHSLCNLSDVHERKDAVRSLLESKL